VKDGKKKRVFIYQVCDHAECYKEVQAQAVSYTTGVPPIVGAKMLFTGVWGGKGVLNVEQLPSKPFLEELAKQGLPWHIKELKMDEQAELFAVKT
jgi:saccharopine dehydrogenase (NAD+, L-lysine forming)